MIAVDTNMLVRYLVKDNHGKAILATEFLAAKLLNEPLRPLLPAASDTYSD